MSAFAWRECPKCSSRTHMNFKCECGGDPWDIDKKRFEKKNERIREEFEEAVNDFLLKYDKGSYDTGCDIMSTLLSCMTGRNVDFITGAIDTFRKRVH